MSHTILVPGPTEGLQDVALLVEGGAAALRLADVGVFRPVPIRHGNASVLGRILAPQSILVLEEVLSVPLKKCVSCSLPLHLHLFPSLSLPAKIHSFRGRTAPSEPKN